MLSVKKAAAMIGMSPSFIYARCKLGDIPHFRFGGSIVIDEADLAKFMKEARVEEPSSLAAPVVKRQRHQANNNTNNGLDLSRLQAAWRQKGVLGK